jgi:hypothetical protein
MAGSANVLSNPCFKFDYSLTGANADLWTP